MLGPSSLSLLSLPAEFLESSIREQEAFPVNLDLVTYYTTPLFWSEKAFQKRACHLRIPELRDPPPLASLLLPPSPSLPFQPSPSPISHFFKVAMLFDPAIDVSLLSETELDQLVQSLPSAFGNDAASKIQTEGLWAKMAEMFDTG